jgi:hypothetical protein
MSTRSTQIIQINNKKKNSTTKTLKQKLLEGRKHHDHPDEPLRRERGRAHYKRHTLRGNTQP